MISVSIQLLLVMNELPESNNLSFWNDFVGPGNCFLDATNGKTSRTGPPKSIKITFLIMLDHFYSGWWGFHNPCIRFFFFKFWRVTWERRVTNTRDDGHGRRFPVRIADDFPVPRWRSKHFLNLFLWISPMFLYLLKNLCGFIKHHKTQLLSMISDLVSLFGPSVPL